MCKNGNKKYFISHIVASIGLTLSAKGINLFPVMINPIFTTMPNRQPPKVKDYILDELYKEICHYEEPDFKYITQTINDTEYFWIEFITDKEII